MLHATDETQRNALSIVERRHEQMNAYDCCFQFMHAD